jgi:hypothetical protein
MVEQGRGHPVQTLQPQDNAITTFSNASAIAGSPRNRRGRKEPEALW